MGEAKFLNHPGMSVLFLFYNPTSLNNEKRTYCRRQPLGSVNRTA